MYNEDMVARIRLDNAERRLLEHESDISETRRIVLDIKQSLTKLEGPVKWMEKLAFVIAAGILGTLGMQLWSVMQNRFPK